MREVQYFYAFSSLCFPFARFVSVLDSSLSSLVCLSS